MGRIDYLHDPDAPPANSVVPSVVAFVQNDAGQVLLIQRSDNGRWALPGGGHDVGEFISDTVVREVWEETGIKVEVIELSGIYTDPGARDAVRRRRGPAAVQHVLPRAASRWRHPYEQRNDSGPLGTPNGPV